MRSHSDHIKTSNTYFQVTISYQGVYSSVLTWMLIIRLQPLVHVAVCCSVSMSKDLSAYYFIYTVYAEITSHNFHRLEAH